MPQNKTNPKPVTMAALAKAAGVARSTVSRALRNDPQISEETRRKVHTLARRMEYRPNPLISTLMVNIRSRKPAAYTGNLAIVTSQPDPANWFANIPTWTHYHQGMVRCSRERGYQLETFSTADFDAEGKRLSGILEARGITGVVLAPFRTLQVGGEVRLDWHRFAMVTLGYSVKAPLVNRVCHRNYRGVQLAARKLTEKGYRRIGLCTYDYRDDRTDFSYPAGFFIFQQSIPKPNRVPPFSRSSNRKNSEALLKWVQTQKPDVILTDGVADIAEHLTHLGLRCPKDIGIASLDVNPEDLRWAGIDHNAELIGVMALDLLIAQIQRNERGLPEWPIIQSIEGKWFDGASVR